MRYNHSWCNISKLDLNNSEPNSKTKQYNHYVFTLFITKMYSTLVMVTKLTFICYNMITLRYDGVIVMPIASPLTIIQMQTEKVLLARLNWAFVIQLLLVGLEQLRKPLRDTPYFVFLIFYKEVNSIISHDYKTDFYQPLHMITLLYRWCNCDACPIADIRMYYKLGHLACMMQPGRQVMITKLTFISDYYNVIEVILWCQSIDCHSNANIGHNNKLWLIDLNKAKLLKYIN